MKVNGDRLPERERLPWDLATILINILNEWPITVGDRQNKKSIIAIIIAEVGLSQRQASCGRSSRRKAATERKEQEPSEQHAFPARQLPITISATAPIAPGSFQLTPCLL